MTWCGMPGWAQGGKILCFFQSAEEFGARCPTFGFNDGAQFDDGTLWPVAFVSAHDARIRPQEGPDLQQCSIFSRQHGGVVPVFLGLAEGSDTTTSCLSHGHRAAGRHRLGRPCSWSCARRARVRCCTADRNGDLVLTSSAMDRCVDELRAMRPKVDPGASLVDEILGLARRCAADATRSEERRVGKECPV